MPRFFNTAGPCRQGDHYMLSPLARLPLLWDLIDRKNYFVLHAARQTGKTTTLLPLAQALTRKGMGTELLFYPLRQGQGRSAAARRRSAWGRGRNGDGVAFLPTLENGDGNGDGVAFLPTPPGTGA